MTVNRSGTNLPTLGILVLCGIVSIQVGCREGSSERATAATVSQRSRTVAEATVGEATVSRPAVELEDSAEPLRPAVEAAEADAPARRSPPPAACCLAECCPPEIAFGSEPPNAIGSEEAAAFTRQAAAYRPPAVELVDQDGRFVYLEDELEHGGPVAVQFFFTSCSTICPALTGSLQTVQEEFGEQGFGEGENLRVLSISIDPAHDTPERLRRFAAQFDAGPRWRFLTGEPADVRAVQRAFEAGQQNKMQHRPLTFLRPRSSGEWVRIEGLLSGRRLAEVIRAELDAASASETPGTGNGAPQ